ncbi:LysR substrate-binding domain-containing protein [Pseudorhodoferax sp.]|uniref:LysR substrate-binding domain-containing protein n=1 Tax=Pseudorhodoferax sp. TaxID=1993553 RepID=UPI002DD63DB6|nr:LysR substrate-binding domain-containing protein [Pseudorhodoferax sp.]
MHFDFVNLRLFVYVAEESNLRRGAERAHLSMAAASTRIKQLEESTGTPLLYRRARGVELTPAGESFLLHARSVLERIDHLQWEMKEYASGAKGHVRILANTTAISAALPVPLARFMAEHPDISVELGHRLSTVAAIAVQDGRADIGVVAGGDINTDGLEVRDFAVEELVLVVPMGHRLAASASTSFFDTLKEPHMSLPSTSALPAYLMAAAHALGRSFKFRIQVASFEQVCLLVEAGVGVGVLPHSSALRHARTMRVQIVRLDDPWARRELKIINRPLSGMPKLVGEVVRHLEANAPGRSGA